MQDNKKNKKNAAKKDNLSHLDLDTANASSSMDCTGLIPAKPESHSEREAYKEICDYEASIKDGKQE